MCKHSDCANYIPIDVAKGICHANGDITVQIDTPTCPKFTPGFKCKFCIASLAPPICSNPRDWAVPRGITVPRDSFIRNLLHSQR